MIRIILAALCVAVLPAGAQTATKSSSTKSLDQPKITITQIDGRIPAKDAYIVQYYVDKAAPESDYETGNLHILYSDKVEVVQKLPPKQKNTQEDIAYNEEGISEPKVSEDRRTIAWTENFDNCCTSYSIALVLGVYRSGKNIVEIEQGEMVWNWMFLDGGKRIGAVWGPVHFSDIGDYQLYEVETGRLLDAIVGDTEVDAKNGTMHGLGPSAPEWAKRLERQNR